MEPTIQENITALSTSFIEFQENVTKLLEKNTAAAGGRSRKNLQQMVKLVKALKKQVQDKRKELKAAKVKAE